MDDPQPLDAPLPDIWWTPSGVRLRRRTSRPGELNWLFLPGGPGIGSESLDRLVDVVDVPGTSWMVDLPGDGSNVDAPGAPSDPFGQWPQVLSEAAASLPNPVFVGHSTGGMYILSTPDLEELLAGMVLVSTAPDASWLPAFVRMTEEHPIVEVEQASSRYEADPSNENLAAIAVSSAPWNFGADTAPAGAEFLAGMPYNGDAVAWSEVNFDHSYQHRWWPTRVPTLILSGSEDRIVSQGLWNDPRFAGDNVTHDVIDGGAHFLWFENPDQTRLTFQRFAENVQRAIQACL